MNFTIKSKLLVILLVACVSATVVGVLGLAGMKASNDSIELIYKENLVNTTRISQIMALMRDNRIQLLLSLQHDPAKPEIIRMHDHQLNFHTDQVTKNIEDITAIWKEYTSGGHLNESEKKMAEDFAEKRMHFVKEGLLATREAVLAGKYEEAVHLTLTKTNPLFKVANDAAQKLYDNEKTQAHKAHEAAVSRYHTTLALVIISILLSILVTLVLGVIIIRSITRSAAKLIKTSADMAHGDLTQRLRLTTRDEFGVIGHPLYTGRTERTYLRD
jgi:methyl-accepting chemotaxis protein